MPVYVLFLIWPRDPHFITQFTFFWALFWLLKLIWGGYSCFEAVSAQKASKKAQIYFNLFGSPWEFVTPSDHCGSPFSFFPLSYRGRAVSSSTVSAGCWWDFHLSTFCRFFYDGGRGLHQSVDIFSPILSTILSLAASINRVGRKGRVAAM